MTAAEAVMHVVVDLPGLRLVTEANNDRHWRHRCRRAVQQRETARLAMQSRFHNRALRFPLTVTITRIAPRALDSDNAVGSAKHVRDGVADALGIDDRDERVTWVVRQQQRAKTYGVRIEIESASAARCPTCGAARMSRVA